LPLTDQSQGRTGRGNRACAHARAAPPTPSAPMHACGERAECDPSPLQTAPRPHL